MEEKIFGKIIEAADKKGFIWKVEIIKAGLSLNNNFYSEEVLQEAITKKLFEGVRSFARSDSEHLKNINESVKNVIGWFNNAIYSLERKSVVGLFHITKDAEWLRNKTISAFESGNLDLFGFSIVGEMIVEQEKINSKNINKILEIIKIDSIDPVVNPSAGGKIIGIGESKNNNSKEKIKMENNLSNSETKNADKNSAEISEALNKIKIMESEALIDFHLKRTNLPEVIKEKIKTSNQGKVLNESEIKNIISVEQDVFAKVMENLKVKESVSGNEIKFGLDERDKLQESLDNMFFTGIKLTREERKSESKYKNAFRSIREAYIQFTGDRDITGRPKHITESIDTSTFSNALANSITKKMVRDYNLMGFDTWRHFVDIIPVSDFKQQERIRIGGYGNLPSVNQGNSYQALSTPSDEKVTYTVSKYGGTETITLEAIKNDDVYALRKIPSKLARAAAQTLHEHIYNWFKNNSTVYDTKAFFHTDHSNLGSSALDSTSLSNARLAMRKQTFANRPLGLRAKFLLVPPDLENIAYNLTRLGYGQNNNVPSFLQEQKIIPIAVDYWTDTNNWFLVADSKDCPVIEVGFLDGKEEPELFVQDQPSNGSVFTNDCITFKIRHIYSSAVIDYKAAFGAIVA